MTIPFVLCALLAQTPGTPPAQGRPVSQTAARDAAKKPGGAKIRGRVTAADTGRPVRKATIRMVLVEGMLPGGPAMVLTDNEGRYEAGDLPAGNYNITASSAGYVASIYGQRRTDEPGKPLEVGENVTVERVNFTLQRGGVITGTVTDEFGDWVVNSTVRAMRVEFQKGRRELVPAGAGTSLTNDIGEFRLYGLPAGEFYVSVTQRVAMGQVGQSETSFPPTFYPGTPNAAEAQPVKVALGQTASIAIAMTSSRAARVSGIVLSADGEPMPYGFLNVTSRSGPGLGVSSGQVNGDGTFVLSGVPPGEYHVQVMSVGKTPDGVSQTALGVIHVAGEDVTDVRLQAVRWSTGAGRLIVEPELRASFKPSAVRVGLQRTVRDDPFTMYVAGANARDDATFTFPSPPGAVFLTTTGLPAGWRVKAVRLNSVDITDTGLDLPSGETVEGIEVELTNRGPHLSGRVTDARGDAVKQYSVVIFPQDREKRSWNSRYLATARPNSESQFTIASLPPGDYYAIALETLATGQGGDPEFLQKWEDEAIKFSIADGETKALALKLSFP